MCIYPHCKSVLDIFVIPGVQSVKFVTFSFYILSKHFRMFFFNMLLKIKVHEHALITMYSKNNSHQFIIPVHEQGVIYM